MSIQNDPLWKFNQAMQSIAIERIYPLHWPGYELMALDRMHDNPLGLLLDRAGIDKAFVKQYGGDLIPIADRFRKYKVWKLNNRDFTIRESEWKRHLRCLKNGGLIPSFYVYGYANEDMSNFHKLYIVHYKEWLPDVLHGRASRPALKDRSEDGENNFYYQPWYGLPQEYIVFEYPLTEDNGSKGNGNRRAQLKLF